MYFCVHTVCNMISNSLITSYLFFYAVFLQAFGIKIKRKQRQDMLTENLKTLTPLERKLSGKMAVIFYLS